MNLKLLNATVIMISPFAKGCALTKKASYTYEINHD